MQPVAQHSKSSRLRAILFKRGISAKEVSDGTGLSLSLIEKISAGLRVATPTAIEKIETFLGERIWSAPKTFKERRAQAEFEVRVKMIASMENLDDSRAQEIARARFPHRFANICSSPPSLPNTERKNASVH
jgi:transcriptional regulator with XRE-family HTH domain